MSRFRRVIHGVASGYLVLTSAAVYALAILPLGLHFLDAERLGLWTLMAGISGYLSQIDLGMSGALARLLIDHKDDRQSDAYGTLIKTGWLVLLFQGLIIGFVGFALAGPLATALAITPDLRPEFVVLMRWMAANLALSFFTKIFSHLLQAHQRMDLINYSQILNLVLAFFLIWYLLHARHGVVALGWATILTTGVGNLLLWLACWRLHLFPAHGHWGGASWRQFKMIFDFAKDIFLVSLGAQLIMASQPMIVTRQLGIASATLWYAGTRVFNLLSQAIWRVSDMALPAFAEMMVRKEAVLLRERYKAILMVTASLSGFAAVCYVLCNSTFVFIWTSFSKKHSFQWPTHLDLLLGLWMIVLAILHCHNSLVIYTKKIGFMRYVYFVEGVVFVALALVAAPLWGFVGIIASSVLCSLCFSCAYGIWRVSRYFELPFRSVAFGWLLSMGRVILMFGPIAAVTWFLTRGLADPFLRLGFRGMVCASAGLAIFVRLGLSPALQRELLDRAPARFNPVLRRVFLTTP
jgi:O-antigen/teichoic acid export membrane protein